MSEKATNGAEELRRLCHARLRALTPQERDRSMQVHLAQARAPGQNVELMRRLTNTIVRARIAQRECAVVKGAEHMVDDEIIDLITVVEASLEQAGITYAITGSVASSVFGEPYASQDVDFVVRMTEMQARSLAQGLPQRFYRAEAAIIEAARDNSMANLIDANTGLKVDLSVLSGKPFHEMVMRRRQRTSFGAGAPEFFTVTPEDIILMKLEWRKDTRSQKQWDNALGVARVRGARMDWKYLFETAKTLGIEDDLIKLRDEAGI